jgi:mRNA-degrading endonuclease toxin of MazEF toxin-antitoxin module
MSRSWNVQVSSRPIIVLSSKKFLKTITALITGPIFTFYGRSQNKERVAAILLENTFTSIPEVARVVFPFRFIRYIPGRVRIIFVSCKKLLQCTGVVLAGVENFSKIFNFAAAKIFTFAAAQKLDTFQNEIECT